MNFAPERGMLVTLSSTVEQYKKLSGLSSENYFYFRRVCSIYQNKFHKINGYVNFVLSMVNQRLFIVKKCNND